MKHHLAILTCAFLLVSTPNIVFASEVPAEQLVELQAAMQTYIDKNSVDGALRVNDTETGSTLSLYAVKAHPMVMRMGDGFELCAEFKDADGKDMQVNFMINQSGKDYVVVDVALASMEMSTPGASAASVPASQ